MFLLAVKEREVPGEFQAKMCGVCFVDTSVGTFHVSLASNSSTCCAVAVTVAHAVQWLATVARAVQCLVTVARAVQWLAAVRCAVQLMATVARAVQCLVTVAYAVQCLVTVARAVQCLSCD